MLPLPCKKGTIGNRAVGELPTPYTFGTHHHAPLVPLHSANEFEAARHSNEHPAIKDWRGHNTQREPVDIVEIAAGQKFLLSPSGCPETRQIVASNCAGGAVGSSGRLFLAASRLRPGVTNGSRPTAPSVRRGLVLARSPDRFPNVRPDHPVHPLRVPRTARAHCTIHGVTVIAVICSCVERPSESVATAVTVCWPTESDAAAMVNSHPEFL
jgi:hypothetical protein